jgi:hypothetical protein
MVSAAGVAAGPVSTFVRPQKGASLTEAEWRAGPHLFDLIDFFGSRAGDRRRRLFACACCRRSWDLLCRESARKSVELAEAFADGEVSEAELRAAPNHPDFADLQPQLGGEVEPDTQLSLRTLSALAAAQDVTSPTVSLLMLVLNTSSDPAGDYLPTRQHNEATGGGSIRDASAELEEKAKLLRDIFGNPFHPLTFDPEWRTSTAVALACQMYESRDFSPMPILADALQDAGCDRADVLGHCRSPGPHVRGCWVVDLVLSKV